jgi:predicted ester cyclase
MTETAASQRSTISDEFARDWVPRFLAAWHSHDPDQLAALATEDVRWKDPFIYPKGVAHGKDELRRWLASIFRAFPDIRFESPGEPMISLDRTRLAFEWAGAARMTGPLDPPGFAPTGATTTFHGVDIHSFRDGLVAEVITATDVSAVAGQIGAMPPPGSIGEKLGVGLQRLTAKRTGRKHN